MMARVLEQFKDTVGGDNLDLAQFSHGRLERPHRGRGHGETKTISGCTQHAIIPPRFQVFGI